MINALKDYRNAKDIYATLLKEANISLASVPKHVYTNPQKRIYVFQFCIYLMPFSILPCFILH